MRARARDIPGSGITFSEIPSAEKEQAAIKPPVRGG